MTVSINATPRRPETLLRLATHFVVHIVIGLFLFSVVAFAAVGFSQLVSWMSSHLPKELVLAARWLEYAVFAVDAVLFALFIARTTWVFGRFMLRANLSET